MHKVKHTARVDSRDSNVLIMNGEGTSLGMPPTSEFSLGTSDLTTPTTTDSPSLPFAMVSVLFYFTLFLPPVLATLMLMLLFLWFLSPQGKLAQHRRSYRDQAIVP